MGLDRFQDCPRLTRGALLPSATMQTRLNRIVALAPWLRRSPPRTKPWSGLRWNGSSLDGLLQPSRESGIFTPKNLLDPRGVVITSRTNIRSRVPLILRSQMKVHPIYLKYDHRWIIHEIHL